MKKEFHSFNFFKFALQIIHRVGWTVHWMCSRNKFQIPEFGSPKTVALVTSICYTHASYYSMGIVLAGKLLIESLNRSSDHEWNGSAWLRLQFVNSQLYLIKFHCSNGVETFEKSWQYPFFHLDPVIPIHCTTIDTSVGPRSSANRTYSFLTSPNHRDTRPWDTVIVVDSLGIFFPCLSLSIL